MSKPKEAGSGEQPLRNWGICTEYPFCVCGDKPFEGNEVANEQRLTRKLLKKYRKSVKDGI